MKNSNRFALMWAWVYLLCGGYSYAQKEYPTFGQVVYDTPVMRKLVPESSRLEVLAGGFKWSEGPVWVREKGFLLFSDIPQNTIFKWDPKEEISVFLKPAGYTGLGDYSNEPGTNGLLIDHQGNLVACEHGDRRLSIMPLESGGKLTLADRYEGKRLNSPNDLVQHPVSKAFYFTDPPYGLPKKQDDPLRELPHFGVYRVETGKDPELLISDLTRPNGVGFSPDGKILYVAVSDPRKAVLMAYPLLDNGRVGNGRLLFDATPMVEQGLPGLPDGLKVDKDGNIWCTGPGGVLVISPAGELLGRINTGRPTANCAWGEDGSTLYITAQNYLCRIRTATRGAGW